MKAGFSGISIIISFLLFLPCAQAAAKITKSAISGYVYSSETNKPIKAAVVKLRRTKPKRPSMLYETATDETGKFKLNLSRGIYEYSIGCPGFAAAGGSFAAGEDSVNLSIPLNREGEILGRIVNSSGDAISGLRVSASDNLSAVTDANGAFRITGTDAQGYGLFIPGRVWVVESPLYISMEAGEKKNIGDITVRRAGSVTIRTVASGNGTAARPLARAELSLSGNLGYRSGKTIANGEITFAGLAPGFYNLGTYDDRIEEPNLSIEIKEGKHSVVSFDAALRPPSLSLDTMEQVYLPKGPVKFHLRGLWIKSARLNIFAVDAGSFRSGGIDPEKPEGIQGNLLSQKKDLSVSLKRERGSHYRSTTVNLGRMEPGMYLIEAVSGKTSTRSIFTVTRLGIVAKSSPAGTLLFATDLISGKPVKDVEIKAFAVGAHQFPREPFSAKTDENGLAVYDGPKTEVRIIGYHGNNTASLNLAGRHGAEQAERLVGYLYTERPVFRPGQTVFFKGILRKRVGEGYALPGLTSVHVSVTDSGEQVIFEKDYPVNDAGSFNGELKLPENPSLGDFELKAEASGQDWQTSFKVLEYRKPEFAVTLKAAHKFRVGGEREELALQAKYYFGAPVAGAGVRYRIYSQPAYGVFPGGVDSDYGDDDGEDMNYYGGYSDFIGEGEVTTDENGMAVIPVTTGTTEMPVTYSVEADVTDIASRQESASAAFLVTPSLVALEVRSNSFLAVPGKAVEFSARALTWEGEPVETPVEIAFEEQLYDKRTGLSSFRKAGSLKIATDGSGRSAFRYTFPRPGYWRVSATAFDEKGRKSLSRNWVWVWREGYAWNSSYRELGVRFDRKTYKPGETARMIVKNPAAGAGILVSVEGREVYDRRVVNPAGAVEVVEIPVLKEYAPYVFVSATVVADGRFYTQTKTLKVDYQPDRLDVKISSDKPVYSPGDTAHLTITATGSGGKPAAAEVSLGVVDEAIYAVSPDDREEIYRFFRGKREHLVMTLNSFPRVYLGGKSKDKALSFAPQEVDKVKVRKVFKDTAFWVPVLETDGRGTARADFVLPDNLTTWRATAVAHTKDSDFGSGLEKFVSRLDVMARLQPPRFFIKGDELDIPGIINNMTVEELSVNGVFEAEGLALDGEGRFTGKVAAGGTLRRDIAVRAVMPGLSLLRLTVNAGSRSDAMELQVPVLPRAMKRESMGNLALRGMEGATTVDFPAEANVEGASLKINLTPTLAASLNESLRQLVDFPYGCVEQTMSRFLPAVYVRALVGTGRFSLDGDVAEKLPKVLDESLKRLYDFQHDDGGWGWWKEGPSDPHMTAYVVYGLVLSRKSGITVKPEVLERGVNALVELSKKTDVESLPFVYRSLALAGKNEAFIERKIEAAWRQLRPSERIYYVDALMVINQKDRAKSFLEALKGQVKQEGAAAYLKDNDALSWWYSWRWAGSAVETTAMLLETVLADNPADPLAPALAQFLVQKRSGRWWNTTRATAAVTKALADYVKATGESDASFSARLFLDGGEIGQLTVDRGKIVKGESSIVVPATGLKRGTNHLRLEKSSPEGALYLTATLNYLVPPENASGSQGLSIERKLYRINSVKEGNDWRMEYQPVQAGESISSGDDIEVRLVVDNRDDMNFVIIEDRLPAGFEVREAKTDLRYASFSGFWDWFVHAERHDERMAFFLDELPAGRHVFRYVMYPELEGTALALPASVWPMYVPSLKSESRPWEMKVIR